MAKSGNIEGLINAGTGLIGTIGGLFQNRRQGKLNRRQQEKNIRIQHEKNMELAQFQHDKNLESWRLANEYNTPAAQRARMEEAGLNPNLFYSQGSAGNAQSIAPFHSPHYEHNMPAKQVVNATRGVEAYFNAAQQILAIQNMRKQNNLLDYQIDTRVPVEEQAEANRYILRERKSQEFYKARIGFEQGQRLMDYRNLGMYQAQVNQLKRNIDYTQTRRENLLLDNAMKQFEVNLNKIGLTRNDPAYMRLSANLTQNLNSQQQAAAILAANAGVGLFSAIKPFKFSKKAMAKPRQPYRYNPRYGISPNRNF